MNQRLLPYIVLVLCLLSVPVFSQTENTTVVVAESTPIIQYVYSPVHVPYYPPHHYGVYLPYFLAFTCVAVHAYRYNHYYYHSAYQRGYYHGGNTV